MGVAQKLKDEGRLTLPGGLEPRDFDLWHEYIANQEFARSVPVGVRHSHSFLSFPLFSSLFALN